MEEIYKPEDKEADKVELYNAKITTYWAICPTG